MNEFYSVAIAFVFIIGIVSALTTPNKKSSDDKIQELVDEARIIQDERIANG